MNLKDMAASDFIALETYRKNGQGVITPVWVTAQDGKLFVWTRNSTGKVKRIRRNPTVKLCQSDGRGKAKSEWIEARARLLSQPEALAEQQKRMAAKYGLQYHVLNIMGKLSRNKDSNIVIELSPEKN
jgi:PPOX class probable F420-dependent enzyme